MRGVAICCAAVLTIVAGYWLTRELLASATVDVPVEQMRFSSREWVDAMRSGAVIEFVRESVDGEKPGRVVRELESLGPIDSDLLPDFIRSMSVESSAVAFAKAMTKAESGNADDYVNFLKERYCFEKSKAAETMARNGDYITLKTTFQAPPVPDGFVMLGRLGGSYVDGKRVDVWFLFDLSLEANRTIKEMKDDWEESEALLADEDVREFNFQDLEVRKAQIEESLAAMRALDGSPPPEEQAALRKKILPMKFMIDQTHYLVSRRIIRRY